MKYPLHFPHLGLCMFIFLLANGCHAFEPIEFSHAEQKVRYYDLLAELRCPQCPNQSLLDSNAMISNDLRLYLYELIQQGYTDVQIKAYLQARYGKAILYRPPLVLDTLLLWLAPFLLSILAMYILRRIHQSNSK